MLRLLRGHLRAAAVAYFRGTCANDARNGKAAGAAERANFIRVLSSLVGNGALVSVYEPGGVSAGEVWRLGDPDGRCFSALCWDSDAGHVQLGVVAPRFIEMPPCTEPWLR